MLYSVYPAESLIDTYNAKSPIVQYKQQLSRPITPVDRRAESRAEMGRQCRPIVQYYYDGGGEDEDPERNVARSSLR